MLASLLARSTIHGRHEIDRYAPWRIALERLRDDWAERRRPPAPRLPEYLEDVPQEQQAEALEDLIALHLDLAWSAGEGLLLENYLAELGGEFAELLSPAVVSVDLVEDEFLARYRSPWGDHPDLDEYRRRFPGRPEVVRRLQSRLLDEGRYVKLQLQGQGAASDVWRAFDRRLRRLVAIKQLRPALLGNAAAASCFAEEVRILAALEHPGIIAVHELHEPPGAAPWCVMPLVEGKTLGQCIREHLDLSDERSNADQQLLGRQLLQAFATVCDAVAYAHARGVLHRDLTPGNVLVGAFGQAVVVDWQRDVVGTPEYMPPEQLDGRTDARSDVFGLGAVLYEILTGRPPHAWKENGRPADWPELVRQARIARPRQLRADAPRALEAVAMKALARDPAERYSSAAELAQAMHRYLAGQLAQARLAFPFAWPWSGHGPLRDLP